MSSQLFEGDILSHISTSPWSNSHPSDPTIANWYVPRPGTVGQGIGLVITPTSWAVSSGSTYHQTAVYCYQECALAGMNASKQRVQGQDTWYRVQMMLPNPGYTGTERAWTTSVLTEWHVDDYTSSHSPNEANIWFGTVRAKNPDGSTAPEHFWFKLAGGDERMGASSVQITHNGNLSCPNYPTEEYMGYKQIDVTSLLMPQLNHWYDLLFHFHWSSTAGTARSTVWIDGQQAFDSNCPNLTITPDGVQGTDTFGVYNYRSITSGSSETRFDEVLVGPTRASVGA
jgi:hypothetical protein